MTPAQFRDLTLGTPEELSVFRHLTEDQGCYVSMLHSWNLIKSHNLHLGHLIVMLKKYKSLWVAHREGALRHKPTEIIKYLEQCAVLCDAGFDLDTPKDL